MFCHITQTNTESTVKLQCLEQAWGQEKLARVQVVPASQGVYFYVYKVSIFIKGTLGTLTLYMGASAVIILLLVFSFSIFCDSMKK